jgi:GT2 family glycosyltransferase
VVPTVRQKSEACPPVGESTLDLEVIIVSHRDEPRLEPCVDSLDEAAGSCAYRTTIVENGGSPISLSGSATRRIIYMPNLGFAAGNNVGAGGSDTDVLLFLNPDTQLARGTLELLVKAIRERSKVGLLAVRQVTGHGRLWPSLHRFPSVRRELAQALASEKWPGAGKRLALSVLLGSSAPPFGRIEGEFAPGGSSRR